MEKILEKLRNYSFWLLDWIKGGKVKKNYNEIKFINENYNNLESIEIRKTYLQSILKHAQQSTNFYTKIDSSVLTDFPVVNKSIIRDNFDQFTSSIHNSSTDHKVLTSGSTGTPFSIYQNKDKRIRNTSDTIYYAERSGFTLGSQLIYIRLWDNQHKKSSFSTWIQNIVAHNVSDLTDKDIEGLLKKLRNPKSNKGILAYASVYDTISQYMDRNKLDSIDGNIKSMIANAEGLSDYAKTSIQKYFGHSVISRYSNVENGIIAQQEISGGDYQINWASYHLEILAIKSDKPVQNGKVGRIVITDLFNYANPMIRYDTGDLGVVRMDKDKNVPVLTKVEGRKMDVLHTTEGELISSHIIHQICLYTGIKQYQLIQEDAKNYLFKINATTDFKEEQKILDTYKQYFGDDSEIRIEYVDDIPLLSSGKRKKVVNKYYV